MVIVRYCVKVYSYGAIQVLRNAVGGGGGWVSAFPEKSVTNVISVTRGWVGVKFPGKKHYVTLEWPLFQCSIKLHLMKCFDNTQIA